MPIAENSERKTVPFYGSSRKEDYNITNYAKKNTNTLDLEPDIHHMNMSNFNFPLDGSHNSTQRFVN